MRTVGKLVALAALLASSAASAADDPAALTAEGLALRTKGDLWAAEVRLRRAVELEPTADRLAELGATSWLIARRMVDRGEGASPGGGATIKGVLLDAARALERSIEMGESVRARVHLGLVKMYLGDERSGRLDLNRAVELGPDDPLALRESGRDAFRRRDYAGAAKRFGRLAGVTPADAEAWLWLGKARYFSAAASETEAALVAALRLRPDLGEGYAYLRGLYLNQGKNVEMARALRSVLDMHPDHTEALGNLGVALAGKGDHEEAASIFRKLVDRDPADLDAACTLAWLDTFHLDRREEGIALFARVLAEDPKHPKSVESMDYLVRRAIAESRLEDADWLLTVWCEADPGNTRAQQNRGLILRRLGRYEAAARAYEASRHANSMNAEAVNDLGLVRLAQDRVTEGVALFEEALEIDPDCLNALENLGIVARLRGDLEAARKWFGRAYKICLDLEKPEASRYRRYLDLVRWDAE